MDLLGNFTPDPSNVDRVYIGWWSLRVTQDGGATLGTIFARGNVGDQPDGGMPDVHAIWVDPGNPDHLIVGYDRGVRTTVDRGGSGTTSPTFPTFRPGKSRSIVRSRSRT